MLQKVTDNASDDQSLTYTYCDFSWKTENHQSVVQMHNVYARTSQSRKVAMHLQIYFTVPFNDTYLNLENDSIHVWDCLQYIILPSVPLW